jgi:hypothetical protein
MSAAPPGERQHRIGGQLSEGHPDAGRARGEPRDHQVAGGATVGRAGFGDEHAAEAGCGDGSAGGVRAASRGAAVAGGKRRALEVVRHHRLIETFLYEVLDYPIEEVHAEAERLEHFISERFEERIAAKLGHPKIDPHGHSIPTMEGEMAARETMLLADVLEDGTFVIDSVSDRDAQHLRLMEARGMTPGARLRVKRNAASEGYSVRVGRSAEVFDLSRAVAQDVRIVRAGK